MGVYDEHKLFIANRGEIAARILRTAKKLNLFTIAIYTPSDTLSPHVLNADQAIPLPIHENSSESKAYLDAPTIVSLAKTHGATLLHPGYGFLSENAGFASMVIDEGITWLGPRPEVIQAMGIKHEARRLAVQAGLDVAPGSSGLVSDEEEALRVSRECGFPVMVKATAGGGGMGMAVCENEGELLGALLSTRERAKSLFGDEGVFLEKYFPSVRHIEIQVFGNGKGDIVHFRERECSVQRRHQKVIEETPSPFLSTYPGLLEQMCSAAVRLAQSIMYASAGTVEFLVDNNDGNFYFLEMNTRIQVEHPVTEATHFDLDIVELMINQGINGGFPGTSPEMQQDRYSSLHRLAVESGSGFSIEARVYAENPYEDFIPSPGLLQEVKFPDHETWLRIDSWTETGMNVTPYFDPLLAKVIVTGANRKEAISRLVIALKRMNIFGPPNNIWHLQAILQHGTFCTGAATTQFLKTLDSVPSALKVLKPGLDATVQDLPGRTIGLGIPKSGPMDSLAFSIGNQLVGNLPTIEGLEVVVVAELGLSLQFLAPTCISVTGRSVSVKVDGVEQRMWAALQIHAGAILEIDTLPLEEVSPGFRVYLLVKGGFPEIPFYLGSKSTSMGLGGYQGRSLIAGDQIALLPLDSGRLSTGDDSKSLDPAPKYPSHWVIYVLPGPHGDEEFITAEGIDRFYSTPWRVSPSSNRLGIRLESTTGEKISWTRSDGGEGGSHPSNILDNGYAYGTINLNGDTPVILTNEGPDMGGYLCMCTVATGEMWKLGQVSPGCTVEFRRISWNISIQILKRLGGLHTSGSLSNWDHWLDSSIDDKSTSPVLQVLEGGMGHSRPKTTFRQAGDSAILVEFGDMALDIFIRARIHAFQEAIGHRQTFSSKLTLCPCIRSILCRYNPLEVAQADLLSFLIDVELSLPEDVTQTKFSGRRLTFPVVLNDRWNREALERYMATTRDKAVYLPSNIEYLARNNGLKSSEEALEKLTSSDWLVLGVGFYLACPFLVPIDPRSRLIGQKMNPSRTYTPRGAIGIAGPVAAIYPIESPGGYQLYGRTLPTWQTWGRGKDFNPSRPWLLQAFDQLHFVKVDEKEYLEFERQFDAGQYEFTVEPVTFSMEDYAQHLESIREEVDAFRERQKESRVQEEKRETLLLAEWEQTKAAENAKIPRDKSSNETHEGDDPNELPLTAIKASIFATIWKIQCTRGQIIQAAGETLVVLEAMKTEIPVRTNDTHVGKRVIGYGPGVAEGGSVRPGDSLVLLR